MAVLTLPTHVTKDDVKDNSTSDAVQAIITDGNDRDINQLIYSAEMVVFHYLGVWMYKNPLRYVPNGFSTGNVQFVDQGEPGITGMPTMPDPMKLAVILIIEQIVLRQAEQFKTIKSEAVGDHKVEFSEIGINQNNFKTFITPNIASILQKYSQQGRFLST